jgi:hypothetical protein
MGAKEMLPKRVLLWKLESSTDPLSLDDSLSHSFISWERVAANDNLFSIGCVSLS